MTGIDDNELDKLKRWLQQLFGDNLVIIVGSGLSCAEGLPGMSALAEELKAEIPSMITEEDKESWDVIASCLESDGLEGALLKHQPNEQIESAIIKVSAQYILREEQKVINECISKNRKLKFSYLLKYIAPSSPREAKIITTNYDRLIEFAAEYEGWSIDSMMVGKYWGHHDPDLSDKLLAKSIKKSKVNIQLEKHDHIKIFKPHGSLDWFMSDGMPITSCITNLTEPLIITPGITKYRKGYDQPFDNHRDKGNKAIDKAKSILCIGYGFNDDHLQTYLTRKIKDGVKTLFLTKGLSDNAKKVINDSPDCKALICSDEPKGTIVIDNEKESFIPNCEWWDVEYFVKGVLE